MSGSVKKVFGFLIVTAVCVILGAFILNLLLPNVVRASINTIETGIMSATGIKYDLNGDGTVGNISSTNTGSDKAQQGVGVQGLDGLK